MFGALGRNQNKGGRLGLGRIRVALADERLAMLGRRRGGRELLEMTVHPENIVSGGENSPEAASSYPAESGDRCGKETTLENRALWQFYSTNLSELTGPPGSFRCQAC